MSVNPYNNDDFSKASEHLRLAISMLSKHKIPPSPLNFRLGYDYVAGSNVSLKEALDQVMSVPQELSSDVLTDIYRRFFVQDQESLETVRRELRQVVESVQSELHESGGKLADYSGTLGHFAGVLGSSSSAEMMSDEVKKVLGDTQSLQASQQKLETNMSHIADEVDALRKELERVKEESLTDSLTGISNRKAFDAALTQTINAAVKEKTSFSMLLLDIDRFKKFNDTFGHLVGDKVLRFVATVLKRSVKGKDMAARFGGEEFAIILPETSLDDAYTVSEQVRKAISARKLKENSNGKDYGIVTISIGVAEFRFDEDPHDLIGRADKALYQAKESGRDRVVIAA